MKAKQKKIYPKREYIFTDPYYFLSRSFLKLLVINKKFTQNKKGTRNMIIFILINVTIGLTEIILSYVSISGNITAAIVLAFLLSTEFLIKILYMFLHSKSWLYAIVISMPVITYILPLWNIYNRKIKKPQTT